MGDGGFCRARSQAGPHHPGGCPLQVFFCHIRTDKRAQRDLPKTEGRTGGPLTPATICAVFYVPLSKVGAGDLCQPLRPGEPTF